MSVCTIYCQCKSITHNKFKNNVFCLCITNRSVNQLRLLFPQYTYVSTHHEHH